MTGQDVYEIPEQHGKKTHAIIFGVKPTNESAFALRVDLFDGLRSLTQEQASAVGRQAWNNARLGTKRGGCINCYWHGKRAQRDGCSELCCILREAALVNDVEINSFASVAPGKPPMKMDWLSEYVLKMAVAVPVLMFLGHNLLADHWILLGAPLSLLVCGLACRRLYYYYGYS